LVAFRGRAPGPEYIETRLASADSPFFVSPLVKFEATVALARQKAPASAANTKPTPDLLRQAQKAVDAFLEDLVADEVAISPEIGRRALDASAAYGRAIGHIAGLNFGDCFAYACARSLNVALLYKGDDFAHTDLA